MLDPWLYKTDYILIQDGDFKLMQPCWCGNFGDGGPDDYCEKGICNDENQKLSGQS